MSVATALRGERYLAFAPEWKSLTNKKALSVPYTRFEKARILGARALQISLGAPILSEVPPSLIDPLAIAEMEFSAGVIPITVVHNQTRALS